MEQKNLGKCSIGVEPNVAGLLSYVMGFVTGIIFFVIEKDNKFVRFHAMQSMLTFGALWILNVMLPYFFFLPSQVMSFIMSSIGIASFILWVILMVKAFQGEMFKLPIVGDIAEKQVTKSINA